MISVDVAQATAPLYRTIQQLAEFSMSYLHSYQELAIWKKSIVWIQHVYQASKALPADEKFGLTSQLRRAAVSVASNIAEGAARNGTREFLHFLSIASGSLAETETLLIITERLQMIGHDELEQLLVETREIGRMLGGLQRSLNNRKQLLPLMHLATRDRSLTLTGH